MTDDGIIRDETGTQRTLGYVLDIGGGDGRARCLLTLDERHGNRHGVLHGGLLAVMLDNAMGAAAGMAIEGEGLSPVVTISMSINFIASARIGDKLVAEAWITGGGRKIKFIDGKVRREDGTLIATATGVFRALPAERRT